MSIEEAKARIDELEGKLVEAYEAGKANQRREIPGEVSLELEDAKTGKQVKSKFKITPGYPTVRMGKEIVSTIALMKVATGKILTEDETRVNTGLKGQTKESVTDFLSAMAAKGAGWLTKVGVILMLLFCLSSNNAEAQISSGRWYQFPMDTLTNASTVNLEFPWTLSSNNTFGYAWSLNLTNLSGTTAATVYVQESLFETGNYWVNRDTLTFSAAGTQLNFGTNQGIRQRLQIVGSGTQSSQVRAVVRYRK